MFLSSAFLGGLAAISIPVIVHLMHSPKATVVAFPSVRFLKACKKKAVRRSRLKNIVLMMVRIALVALVAMAMARPWLEQQQTAIMPDAPLAAIIILDNSYSMGVVEQGRSRFDRARDLAVQLVDSLKSSDQAAVILMNEQPETLVRDLTTDHERVKKALRSAQLSYLGSSVGTSLREAIRLVKRAGKTDVVSRRAIEIVLLTDMQASAWDTLLKSKYLQSLGSRIKLYIAGIGQDEVGNMAIDSVKVASSGAGECTITANVIANGLLQTDSLVSLTVNATVVGRESFAVNPAKPAKVPLVARFDEPGYYRCELALQNDALKLDDVYHFIVHVGDKASVLVVDGDPQSVPSMSESFYLRAALSPAGIATGGTSFEARFVSLKDFPNAEMSRYGCILLCNVPRLDGAELVKLENFLRKGGSLFMFLGNKVNPSEMNQWTFMPFRLTSPEGDRTRTKSFTLEPTARKHEAVNPKLDLRTARFFSCYASDKDSLKKDATVLLRFSNGLPALIESHFGEGKVMLFTSSADMEWTNFPLRRSFLPWLYSLVQYLSNQETSSQEYLLNEPITFRGLASAYKTSITITDPLGNPVVLHPKLNGSYSEAEFTGTGTPGIYQVQAHSSFTNSRGFAINVGRRESDLTAIKPERIAKAAPEVSLVYINAAKDDLVQFLQSARTGRALWPLLLKIALAIFVLESLLANWMSRTRETGKAKVPFFDVLRRRAPGMESIA